MVAVEIQASAKSSLCFSFNLECVSMLNRLKKDTKTMLPSIACTMLLSAFCADGALADDPGAVKGACAAPVAVAGALTGIIFGTPIAIARMSGRSMSAIYHEYDNDPVCWQFWGRPCALPLGLVEGTIKGCIVGPRNAFRHAKNKPFSREAFSLEDLD
jgi:hypothetical protein